MREKKERGIVVLLYRTLCSNFVGDDSSVTAVCLRDFQYCTSQLCGLRYCDDTIAPRMFMVLSMNVVQNEHCCGFTSLRLALFSFLLPLQPVFFGTKNHPPCRVMTNVTSKKRRDDEHSRKRDEIVSSLPSQNVLLFTNIYHQHINDLGISIVHEAKETRKRRSCHRKRKKNVSFYHHITLVFIHGCTRDHVVHTTIVDVYTTTTSSHSYVRK